MPFRILREDITKMKCDAVVNPTDSLLSGRGGTDMMIHEAAGPELTEACRPFRDLRVGEIAVTDGYGLPCRHIFHTVGPIWEDGSLNEEMLLRGCYVNALLKARMMSLRSIAFPLISSGTFGFPKDKVMRVAIDAVSDFLFATRADIEIYVCILNLDSYTVSKDVALKEYLAKGKTFVYRGKALAWKEVEPVPPSPPPSDLAAWIEARDETFSDTVKSLIKMRKMKPSDCYTAANVSKATFSKLNKNTEYQPSKEAALGFAIAFKMDVEATNQLIKKAGYTLSESSVTDRIVRFYIMNEEFNVHDINSTLTQYGQLALGSFIQDRRDAAPAG